MVDLEPGQADHSQVGDHLVGDLPAAGRPAGMREHGDPARAADKADSLRRIEGIPGYVRAAARTDPLRRERLVDARDRAGLDHRPGDVWPADDAPARDLADLLPSDRYAKLGQFVDHGTGAVQPAFPDLRHLAGQR